MKPETALIRLIKQYGLRRALTLFGVASTVAVGGWDILVGDMAYTRQGVWIWKRELEKAKIDPFAIEWEGFERSVGGRVAQLVVAATEARLRQARAAAGRRRGESKARS